MSDPSVTDAFGKCVLVITCSVEDTLLMQKSEIADLSSIISEKDENIRSVDSINNDLKRNVSTRKQKLEVLEVYSRVCNSVIMRLANLVQKLS